MRGNHAPRALHHELHDERARDEHRNAGACDQIGIARIARTSAITIALRRPIRSLMCPKTIPPVIAPTIENAGEGRAVLRREPPVALKERRIHVLRAMRYEVHHRHEHDEIEEELPVRHDRRGRV